MIYGLVLFSENDPCLSWFFIADLHTYFGYWICLFQPGIFKTSSGSFSYKDYADQDRKTRIKINIEGKKKTSEFQIIFFFKHAC